MTKIKFLFGAALLTAAFWAAVPVYGAESWTMENGVYIDASGQPVAGALAKGITVSKYQNRASEGGIDWQAAAADGISFAMVRLGYYQDMDPYFSMNIEGAAAAGMDTGVFFYTQALDTETAVKEAEYVLEIVKEYPVSYPIAYDVESQHLLDNGLTRQQITDQVNAFCSVIQAAGYCPIVYANHQWLTEYMDTSQIPYDIWYARYGSVNDYPNRTIWQCAQDGTVDGIQGNVTVELAFVDYKTKIPSEGWKNIKGRWYYMKDYRKQTGWIESEGKQYYLDPNGVMIHDTTMEVDGAVYTFDSSGAVVS